MMPDTKWLNWRANKLTEFLGKLYHEIKVITSPHVVLNMVPSIHTWTKAEYLQDWLSWLMKVNSDYVILKFIALSKVEAVP
jgi:uncharacterized lipoprotein YddW (UPF0748 family)